MDTTKWKKLKKTLWLAVLVWTLSGMGLSAFTWGVKAGFVTLLGSLCLLAGFFITELLIGVLAGVKKANPTAIALLFLGKLFWWAGLFWLAKHLSADVQLPLAIGMGAFLLSLISSVLLQYGMPKISDAN